MKHPDHLPHRRRRRPQVLVDAPPARPYGPRLARGQARRCRTCSRVLDPTTKRSVCRRCIRAGKAGRLVQGPCAVCACFDLRVLAVVDLVDGAQVLCANHEQLVGPGVTTLAELHREAALLSPASPPVTSLPPPELAGAELLEHVAA